MRSIAAVFAGLALAAFIVGIAWRLTSSRPDQPLRAAADGPLRPSDGREPRTLAVPLTQEERERAEYDLARKPFMTSLQAFASLLQCEVFVGDDLSELCVVASVIRHDTVQGVRDEAIRLGAEKHGFRMIRFYERRPEGSGLPHRLVAEVALHEGRWTTFFR